MQRDRMISNLLEGDMSDLTPFLDEKDVTDVSVGDSGSGVWCPASGVRGSSPGWSSRISSWRGS